MRFIMFGFFVCGYFHVSHCSSTCYIWVGDMAREGLAFFCNTCMYGRSSRTFVLVALSHLRKSKSNCVFTSIMVDCSSVELRDNFQHTNRATYLVLPAALASLCNTTPSTQTTMLGASSAYAAQSTSTTSIVIRILKNHPNTLPTSDVPGNTSLHLAASWGRLA